MIGESHLTLSEVSVKEQGQRRFKQTRKQSQNRLHINCKRVSKIVWHSKNAHFSYVLTLAKIMVVAKKRFDLK